MTTSSSIYKQAMTLRDNGNMEESYRLLLEAALLDSNTEALESLGKMYYYGDYVRQDYDKSGRYFAMAFENGGDVEPWTLIIAGDVYEKRSVDDPEAIDSALKFYKAATDEGISFGYECMAKVYADCGEYEKAYESLIIPEALNPLGMYYLSYLYENDLGIDKDLGKAKEYYKQAVDAHTGYEDEYGPDMHSELSKARLCKLESAL